MTHKKSRTTGKRPRRTGEKAAQNTGIDFLALGLRVVLSLPTLDFRPCPLAREGFLVAPYCAIQRDYLSDTQGPPNGGVSNGGVSRSGLVLPFLSFLGLSRFYRDFPDLLRDVRGFSRFVPFLFLGLLRAPTRNSPERVRDTIWTFPEKSGKPPGLETPRFSFSQDTPLLCAMGFFGGPIWLDDRGVGQRKWLEEVPRRTSLAPLASPCFVLCFIGVETEGLLDCQGRAGIISIVRWNLRPVIFGVDLWHLNMANWVRYPLSLFWVFPPWRTCEAEVRCPPPQKGYLSDTGAIPYESKANGWDTPLCDTISKRKSRDGGGYLALGH